MYSEKGVGLDELQRLLSVKIILVLSNIFFISSTLSKIYSTSAQVTKGIKEERLCIWGFILLFVQAEKLLQNNRYLSLWEDAVPKKRGKKKTTKNQRTPYQEPPHEDCSDLRTLSEKLKKKKQKNKLSEILLPRMEWQWKWMLHLLPMIAS